MKTALHAETIGYRYMKNLCFLEDRGLSNKH